MFLLTDYKKEAMECLLDSQTIRIEKLKSGVKTADYYYYSKINMHTTLK